MRRAPAYREAYSLQESARTQRRRLPSQKKAPLGFSSSLLDWRRAAGSLSSDGGGLWKQQPHAHGSLLLGGIAPRRCDGPLIVTTMEPPQLGATIRVLLHDAPHTILYTSYRPRWPCRRKRATSIKVPSFPDLSVVPGPGDSEGSEALACSQRNTALRGAAEIGGTPGSLPRRTRGTSRRRPIWTSNRPSIKGAFLDAQNLES